MPDKKIAIVVKIEYEIEDNREKIWTAYIMSHSQDEAVKYLAKFLKRTIKVTGVSMVAPRVDGLTEEVRESIAGPSAKKKAKLAAKEKKEIEKIKKKAKAKVRLNKEDEEELKKARKQALEDLKKQGVDIYEPTDIPKGEKKEEKKKKEEKPTPKPKTAKKPMNIKMKK